MFTNNFPSWEKAAPTSPRVERLALSANRALCPPPRISVPDWADRYRYLAREAGSTSGRWETATVEVARGPMLAVTEPGVHIITAMVSTQLLKTALLENVFGYFAHLDPCPMLLLQPKEDAAEQFSKERVTPMVKATPVLRELIGTGKTRNSDETLLYKAFPGGFLALAGAGSPDNLARRPVRLVLSDEVDKYPVTREGDPIALAEERTATFGLNWLSVRACSPTVQEESRIEASYLIRISGGPRLLARIAVTVNSSTSFATLAGRSARTMRAKYWSITRRRHGSSVNAAEPNGLRVSAYARSRLSAGIRPDRLYAATIVKCRWMSMRSHGGKGPLPTPRLQMRGPGPRATGTPCIARDARIVAACL